MYNNLNTMPIGKIDQVAQDIYIRYTRYQERAHQTFYSNNIKMFFSITWRKKGKAFRLIQQLLEELSTLSIE